MNVTKQFWKRLGNRLMPLLLLLVCVSGLATEQNGKAQQPHYQANRTRLEKMIRHELIMLPYYTVFDNLQYQVQDTDIVVLSGQVVWPNLKSDAEHAVKKIEGVKQVINKIEVLPLLPFDNTIRRREFYAIYGSVGFERYAIQSVPPIHIIVKNGQVTLVGKVADSFDKHLAEMAARQVPQVFSVTNKLQLENNE